MKSFILLLCAFFVACTPESEVIERLQINKRYPLESWPDSTYIASLDSILAAEPILKDTSTNKEVISINPYKMPLFTLPKSHQAKAQSSSAHKATSSKSEQQAEVQTSQKEETFVASFSKALERWQSDLSNPDNFRVVKANEEEDVFKLLSRIYGKEASKLPHFYTLSTLQSVNPGVSLEHLKKGDAIRIPKW